MAAILYPIFALAYYLLFRWTRRLLHAPQDPPMRAKLLLAVITGLIYDTVIIFVGRFLGEGKVLQALSLPRFLFHALFTPLLIIVVLEYARRADFSWAKRKSVLAVGWLLTLALIVWGVMGEMGQELVTAEFEGTLRYVHAIRSGPPIPSLVTVVFAIVIGVLLWKPAQWPWLAISAALMLVGSAIPTDIAGPLASSAGELLFVWGLVATEKRAQQLGLSISDDELESRFDFFSSDDST